jgi:hypothetical protein
VFPSQFSIGCSTAAAADDLQPAAGVYAMSSGRHGAIVAALVGLIGMALGGLVVATADGGIGTGNGLGRGIVALVVGLIGIVLGGLALAHSRRTG